MTKYDRETLTALRQSIEKWERNALAESPDQYSVSRHDCPLCSLFYDQGCRGCPVYESTGRAFCANSPYVGANISLDMWEDERISSRDPGWSRLNAQESARAEVNFLRSLWPAGVSIDDREI